MAREILELVGAHVVYRSKAGQIYCSCPAWRFQRIPAADRSCKHTKALTDRHQTLR